MAASKNLSPKCWSPLTRPRVDPFTCERMGLSVGVARTADDRRSSFMLGRSALNKLSPSLEAHHLPATVASPSTEKPTRWGLDQVSGKQRQKSFKRICVSKEMVGAVSDISVARRSHL